MADVEYGDIWRLSLDDVLPVLLQNLLMNEFFYSHLIQKRIFTQDSIEDIKSEATGDGRILKLVGYLKKKTNQCFDDFLSILESTDNRFVKEIIEGAIRKNRLKRRKNGMEEIKSSELLKQKDRLIRQLEQELSDLTQKFSEAEHIAKIEMDRSKYYLEVINSLTSVRYLSTGNTTMDDRDSVLDEMEVEIESLKEEVEELKTKVQKTSEERDKMKRQLSIVVETERKMKRNLGLQEDADEMEVMTRIQEMKRSQTELKTTQNELERIFEMKDVYAEKIRKLTQDFNRVDTDRRRKDLQLQRMRRNKEDSHILLNARSILSENKPSYQTEVMNLPRIDINPRLPSARIRNSNKRLSYSIDLSTRTLLPLPNSTVRGIHQTIQDKEPRYCVLCRNEFHTTSQACRIHTGSKHDGQYVCCKAVENGVKPVGCRTLHTHIYVRVIGVDCRFYDQQGRLLCFKDYEGEDHATPFLSVR